jgi:Flp pilus assembly protein TadB
MTEEAAKKGRPTPSRKDAESKRKVSTLAPAIGKEAKKREKDLARERRLAAREAYLRGDENALPLRDRGPVRRYVRDEVDARRSIGEYFLPIIFVVLLFSVVPNMTVNVIAIILMYTVLLIAVVDGFFLSRKLKKQIAEKFPDANPKGLGMYGWLRSTQMRRLRAPKPSGSYQKRSS